LKPLIRSNPVTLAMTLGNPRRGISGQLQGTHQALCGTKAAAPTPFRLQGENHFPLRNLRHPQAAVEGLSPVGSVSR